MTDPATSTPAPTARTRVLGFDIARAIAILGMVIVNFKVVMGAEEIGGPAWLERATPLLDGRAAATFVILAGLGASIGSARIRRSGGAEGQRSARVTLARRGAFLFVIGVTFIPIWPADILHFYGVYLAIGSLVLFTSDRRLWWAMGASVLIAFVFLVSGDYFADWDLDTLSYDGLWTPIGFLKNTFLDGFHPVFPWIAFYLFGMWLGRIDLTSRAVQRRALAISIPLVVATEAVGTIVVGKYLRDDLPASEEWRYLFGTFPLPPVPLYLVAGGGTAVIVIVLCVMAGQKWPNGALLRPLVLTGQLALTIYVAHVVIGMGFLDAIGRLENQTLVFAVATSSVFVAASIVFSVLWRSRYHRGPLEAIMRQIA